MVTFNTLRGKLGALKRSYNDQAHIVDELRNYITKLGNELYYWKLEAEVRKYEIDDLKGKLDNQKKQPEETKIPNPMDNRTLAPTTSSGKQSGDQKKEIDYQKRQVDFWEKDAIFWKKRVGFELDPVFEIDKEGPLHVVK